MKKILSILMILVLVGGVAFAQYEPSFEGSATLSWGIDLGKGTKGDDAKISHGFLNEATASVSLPFVKSGDSKGEGDVYAFINLSGVSLGLAADMDGAKATGKVGGVEAKVVFHKFYLTIYDAPNMSTNYATRVVVHPYIFGGPFKNGFGGYGTKIGYADKEMKDLNVGLKFVSNGSWKDRDAENKHAFIKLVQIKDGDEYDVPAGHGLYKYSYDGTKESAYVAGPGATHDIAGAYALWRLSTPTKGYNGKYGFGIDFHMVPLEKYLTVDANFNMTLASGNDYHNGVKPSWKEKAAMNFGVNLKSSPIEGLNLALGFDGGSAYKYTDKDGKTSGVFAWALGFGADYTQKMVGTVDLGVYVASKATPYGKGSVVDADKGTKDGMDMAMTVGYSGLPIVEGLDLHARVNVFRLLSKRSTADKNGGRTVPLGFNVGVAYTAKIPGSDFMSIKPYADVWGETNIKKYADGTALAEQKAYFGFAYKLGVEFMPMEHLTIDAYFEQGKRHKTGNFLMGTGYMLGLGAPMNKKSDNGRIVVSAKITY